MSDVVELVRYVNLALYTAVALLALQQWRRHRERAGVWAALTFGALALVVDAAQLVPEQRDGLWEEVAGRALIATLVLFPYLLYRFAVSFRPPGRSLSLVVGTLTAAMVVWTFALPELPAEGEAWPRLFALYVIAFTLHWTLLTVVVAWRLWTAGRGEAGVPRRRMRLLALAAAAITLALLVSIAARDGSEGELVPQLLSTASAVMFALGLAPPPSLRMAWRHKEQERLRDAIADLMSATTTEEVLDRVLPGMAEVVGARGVEFRDRDGAVLGTYGSTGGPDERVVRLDTPAGGLAVRTSPYAPFFGDEELGLLQTLAALTDVALDRARLFTTERESRVALERADAVKTNFIALAAHELRTPVATVHGLVETIHARRGELPVGQLTELEAALRNQTARMQQLVEQLLDLSRLDADAVEIEPRRVVVQRHLEEIVTALAGRDADVVRVEVDPTLEVDVDPDALERIVSNLVVNALRHGDAPVVVSAQQSDRHFRLTVEDRGPGIDDEFVPELFERFSRSDDARTRSSGTGLGLAIARSYALAHHGDLIYEPADPHGARFEFVLPVSGQ